jgi:ribonuclease Y
MNEYMFGLIGIAIGFGLTFLLKSILDRQKQTAANLKSEQIVTEARHQADTLIKEASLEAKDRLIKMSRNSSWRPFQALTAEQAKELLMRAMENEARYEGAKLIKRIENEAKEEADKKAKKIHRHGHPALCR